MLKISQRAEATIFSPNRKFAPLITAAEKRGVKVYKLNVGDPDLLPPPEFMRRIRAYPHKNLGYVASRGAPEHLAAWVDYYRELGVKLKPENIIPTVGGAEAILFAIQAVADPGDEIILFEPAYVSYRSFAAITGVKLVPVLLKLENNFALPPTAQIARKLTRKTKAIIIINPDNPTGKLWSKAELGKIAALAKKFGLYIISDETYREIRFRGRPTTFLADHSVRDNVILVDSASKRFSIPGARLGCIASFNPAVMQAVLKFAQARLSVGMLEQYALSPLLRDAKRITKPLKAEYLKRRNAIHGELQKIPGVVCSRPEGAFYIIACLPVDSAENFVRFMLNDFAYRGETVAISPIRDFYLTPGLGEQEVRLAYILSVPKLKRAAKLIRLGLEVYKKVNSR